MMQTKTHNEIINERINHAFCDDGETLYITIFETGGGESDFKRVANGRCYQIEPGQPRPRQIKNRNLRTFTSNANTVSNAGTARRRSSRWRQQRSLVLSFTPLARIAGNKQSPTGSLKHRKRQTNGRLAIVNARARKNINSASKRSKNAKRISNASKTACNSLRNIAKHASANCRKI